MGISGMMLKMMTKSGAKVKEELDAATMNPGEEQGKLLKYLLEKSRDTEFGKKYDFATINSYADFCNRIPFTDYDFYSSYIERMAAGEENILTPDKVVHFNETSGTLGVPKKIPVVEDHVNLFSKYYSKYVNYIASEAVGTDWMDHKCFSLTEGTYVTLPSGITYGCASSLMAARIGRMIPGLKLDMGKSMYSSPLEARQPAPGTPTRFVHALFALMDPSLSYGNATFSSYMLEVMRYIEDNWQKLVEIIRTGKILIEMPDDVKASLSKKIRPMPARAAELQAIFEEGFDTPIVPRIWPNMRYMICVGGAGFSIYTEKLRKRYCGEDMPFVFLGLSASEGMFSVPFEVNNPDAVFIPNGVFMEFIPVDSPGTGTVPVTKLLNELEVGKQYEIVVTNLGGLFRYRMRDIVEITGFYNKTPTMRFKSRAGYAVNMFGEKTSELALQQTAARTAEKLGLDLYDYAVYPDSDASPGKYVMCLELRNNYPDREIIRDTLEKELFAANPDMDEITAAGICGHLDLKLLQPETFLLYRDVQIMRGRSAAQLKPVHVLNETTRDFFFTLEEQ